MIAKNENIDLMMNKQNDVKPTVKESQLHLAIIFFII